MIFTEYMANEDAVDEPLGPTIVTHMGRGWTKAAKQQQQGIFFSKEGVH